MLCGNISFWLTELSSISANLDLRWRLCVFWPIRPSLPWLAWGIHLPCQSYARKQQRGVGRQKVSFWMLGYEILLSSAPHCICVLTSKNIEDFHEKAFDSLKDFWVFFSFWDISLSSEIVVLWQTGPLIDSPGLQVVLWSVYWRKNLEKEKKIEINDLHAATIAMSSFVSLNNYRDLNPSLAGRLWTSNKYSVVLPTPWHF